MSSITFATTIQHSRVDKWRQIYLWNRASWRTWFPVKKTILFIAENACDWSSSFRVCTWRVTHWYVEWTGTHVPCPIARYTRQKKMRLRLKEIKWDFVIFRSFVLLLWFVLLISSWTLLWLIDLHTRSINSFVCLHYWYIQLHGVFTESFLVCPLSMSNRTCIIR